ncbi:hypothetical protein FJP64_12915 [Kosakonia cowanii]|uniref:hypothetical protein n=1 Tax=Kosakonia cowanii TaxID=208223 RepID=UPI00111E4072|nr:hypothetical protein [Kosakonia cowanii]MDP9766745.1 hypothetical protein [Atlantibacter hermannii]TPD64375.1 hypothetical protein FJP70_14520 [Kosakonia cowanii]TPD88707.1 hypothetical protein FJP67_14530 [Kosakonia cowanii]TPE04202.1 hypothetical protein FJP64_12915 [Kosakonia cowanii]
MSKLLSAFNIPPLAGFFYPFYTIFSQIARTNTPFVFVMGSAQKPATFITSIIRFFLSPFSQRAADKRAIKKADDKQC